MTNRNGIIGNDGNDNSAYCFAKDGEVYLVYLPDGGSRPIKLPVGPFRIAWLNPRSGEMGQSSAMNGNNITAPDQGDWLALIRKN